METTSRSPRVSCSGSARTPPWRTCCAGGDPAALETYYALDAVGYRLPPLPALERLDVPYLGTVLLEAAGLPLPDAYRERRRLMLLCGGRYHDCPERGEVLRFHRRLLDSALIDPL